VWLVHLPGREIRIGEPPVSDMLTLAADAALGLRPFLSTPFALFGHSMGALMAFELARTLRRQGAPVPVSLAVSAHPGPQVAGVDQPLHTLPLPDFLQALGRLNETSAQVLRHAELLELVLPMLRADFRAVETYRYAPDAPLNCAIFTYGGSSDPEVSRGELEAWREQTTGAFSLQMFPGDHFYLHASRSDLWAHLARDLGR
jgi:medium-chain acyl-[acyl-carrier-protein] hydrolase